MLPTSRAAFLLLTAAFASAADNYPPPPAAASAATPINEERRAFFVYDRAADFALEEKGTETRGDAIVRDVTFLAMPGQKPRRVAATIVVPKNSSPRAAILWVHWLGNPATTNRTEFIDEAVALAGHGV